VNLCSVKVQTIVFLFGTAAVRSAQHPLVSLDQLRVKIRLHLASQLNLGSDVVPDAVKDESRVANVVAEQLVDMPAPTRCT
jgi:hypothetical protein